jgi:hypothetical protein
MVPALRVSFLALALGMPAQQWTLVTPTATDGVCAWVGERYLCLDTTGRMIAWDGGGWQSVGSYPAQRYPVGLAFDHTTGDAIAVFSNPQLGYETWILRNGVWLQTPAPTNWGTLVYDPAGRRVMNIHAEQGSTAFEHWTGTAWSRLLPATRPLLHGASIAADPRRRQIFAFGGNDAFGKAQDHDWAWDGVDWRAQPYAFPRPSPRCAAMLAWEESTGDMVLFGGTCGGIPLQDTWKWNGHWVQRFPAHSPPAQYAQHASMTFDRSRQAILLFQDNPRQAWEWTGTDWRLLPESVTPAYMVAAATDLTRSRVVGLKSSGGVFEYDGRHWTLIQSASSPPPRFLTSLAYLPSFGTVCFGGISSPLFQPLGDTWTWNGATWRQATVPVSPPARLSHGMAWAPGSGGIILFVGSTALPISFAVVRSLGDTWLWNGVSWTDLTPSLTNAPPAGPAISLGLHLPTADLVLPRSSNQVWLWNGAWRSVTTTVSLPSGPFSSGMTPLTLGYMLVGGDTPHAFTWSGSDWVTAPSPPQNGGLILDVVHNCSLVLGSQHFLYTPTPAASTAFGSGCGSPPPQLDTCGGNPRIDTSGYQLRVYSLPALASVSLAVDTTSASVALPGGCTQLLASPQTVGIAVANPFGHARFALPIPNAQALRGMQLSAQAVALVPGGPLLGALALSQGLLLTIGD